jgi:hypothetical protein
MTTRFRICAAWLVIALLVGCGPMSDVPPDVAATLGGPVEVTPPGPATPATLPPEAAPPSGTQPRPLPDTTDGVHVFNDQLPGWMSDAQVAFAATHYAGTQKMTRVEADRLRAVNPEFVILHYRLGIGLGFRIPGGDCQPTDEVISIIEGDWVPEWPGQVEDSWFTLVDGQRVYNCDWGWYLVNLDDPSWRAYWLGEVLRQLDVNDNDGVFVDSISVPNYMGYDRFSPPLPEVDPAFEAAWTQAIDTWLAAMHDGLAGRAYLIPNVGAQVTTRDQTTYAAADGVMVEGFGDEALQYFSPDDWRLQMERTLAFVNRGQAVIAQGYVDPGDVRARLFTLGSYLLIKGDRSYINLEVDYEPEWFPEYDLPIGAPVGPVESFEALYRADWGAYARAYSGGLVVVNPDPDPASVMLDTTYYQVTPVGGGLIGEDGRIPPDWRLETAPVTELALGPGEAAILLSQPPE